jgi:excinuclease ABC subunit A
MPTSINILDYYTQHSFMTDPGEYSDLFAELPNDIPALTRVVQGLLIHPFCAHMYNVQLSPKQSEEVHLRSLPQMLARIREIDPAPLAVAREPNQRLVGNCRDHAVFFAALLRDQGIPARVRVGFASYLSPRKNEDH